MTIGAGFRCRNGVVLCADTQLTWEGWHKRQGSKITKVGYLRDRLFFVQADIIPAGRNLIGRLAKAVHDDSPSTLSAIEALFSQVCKDFREEEERCPQLLVAVRAKTRVVLYEVDSDFRVTPVDHAAYIGSGAGVVGRVNESYFAKGMSVREAAFVATYAVKEGKDFGSDVGGHTQIVCIPDSGGWYTIQDAEIARLENDYETVQALVGRLLTTSGADQEFKTTLRKLESHLHKAYKRRGH